MGAGRAGTLGALLLAAVVAGGIGTMGAGSSADAQAGPTCVSTPGQVTVAVVIDDGRNAPTIDCLAVGAGTTGVQLMNIRAQRLGKPALRFDLSGLLCAIDGYPAPPACGAPAGGGAYEYWSYWGLVNGSWRYATTGPASREVRDGDIEGWHFITGTGTGADNAPRVAPSSITFGPAPVPTTTRPTTTRPGSTTSPTAAPTTRPTSGSAPQATVGSTAPGARTPPASSAGNAAGGPSAAATSRVGPNGQPPVRVDGVTSTALGSAGQPSPVDPAVSSDETSADPSGSGADATSGSRDGSGRPAPANSTTDERSTPGTVTVSGADDTRWATVAGAGSLAAAIALGVQLVRLRRRPGPSDDTPEGPDERPADPT